MKASIIQVNHLLHIVANKVAQLKIGIFLGAKTKVFLTNSEVNPNKTPGVPILQLNPQVDPMMSNHIYIEFSSYLNGIMSIHDYND